MRPEDVGQVARLHALAFPGYFLTHMGQGFLRRLYTSFLEKPGFPFVALEGDVVVGFVVGVIGERKLLSRFYRANLVFVAGNLIVRVLCDRVVREGARSRLGEHIRIAWSSFRPRSSRRRAHSGLQLGAADGATCRAVGGLMSIAVAPDCRGRGVAESLVAALCKALGQEGISEVRLSVRRDNLRARRFYEKNGWVLTHEDKGSCGYHRQIRA